MKKIACRLSMLVMLFSLILAGCSMNSESNSANPKESDTKITDREQEQDNREVVLKFWRNSGNSAENQAYEELVAQFMTQNPNIRVEMTPIPYSDYATKIRTALAAGNPPDVLAVDSPELASYAHAEVIRSLDPFMKEDWDIDDIPETTLNWMKYNGETYLAPIVESGIAMFYNIKLFEEKGVPLPSQDPNNPWTWEQVLDAAKKLNDPASEIYGIDPAQGFSDGEAAAYFKMPILWQFGAEILSPDGTTAKGYLDSPEALEALRFYQDLYQKHGVAALELPPDPFATGKVAISIDGSWALSHLKNNFPDFKLGEDYGIAPLPKQTRQAAPNGGWALGIASATEYPEEAWEFIKFVTSYEGVKKYVEITGDLPARYSVAQEFQELNEYPKNVFLVQAQKYSKNRPVTPAYPAVSKAIKELFEDVGIGGRNVEAAAAQAVEKIDIALKSFNK